MNCAWLLVYSLFVLVGGVLSQYYFQSEDDEGRIVGGQPTTIEHHPYQVSVRFNKRHICGGAVISETWVVTAAHCVDNTFTRYISIKAGISDLRSRGMVVGAKKIIIHDEYDRYSSDYDIALIRLETPLEYSRRIKAILLAPFGENYTPHSEAEVTGWGDLRSNGPTTTRLRRVKVPIISNSECSRLYSGREITGRMLCAGDVQLGGKDACQGDSGGPLVQYGKLIGIVSWGFGCAEPSHPGVYTRVAALRSWITEQSGI